MQIPSFRNRISIIWVISAQDPRHALSFSS